MKLLAIEQHESYDNEEICYICKEKFENKYLKVKINIIAILKWNIEVPCIAYGI